MGCNWHFQCTPSQKTPPHPRGSVWGISKCKRNKSESFKSTSNTDCPERCNAAASKAAMLVVPTPPRNPENPTTVLFTKPLSLVLVLTHLFLAGHTAPIADQGRVILTHPQFATLQTMLIYNYM